MIRPRLIFGRRVGNWWIGVSQPIGRSRYRRYPAPPPPRWAMVLGLVVGLTFFICVMAVVFG